MNVGLDLTDTIGSECTKHEATKAFKAHSAAHPHTGASFEGGRWRRKGISSSLSLGQLLLFVLTSQPFVFTTLSQRGDVENCSRVSDFFKLVFPSKQTKVVYFSSYFQWWRFSSTSPSSKSSDVTGSIQPLGSAN